MFLKNNVLDVILSNCHYMWVVGVSTVNITDMRVRQIVLLKITEIFLFANFVKFHKLRLTHLLV